MNPLIAITPESITLPQRWDGHGSFCGVSYSQAVAQAGGVPVILPLTDELAQLDRLLDTFAGWVFGGGADVHGAYYGLPRSEWPKVKDADPVRDRMELYLLRQLAERDAAVLGICRGIQIMNVAFGGTLRPDIPNHRDPQPDALAHRLRWASPNQLPVCTVVNTSHHQAVDQLAPGLTVVARAPDGIIEAVEKPDARFYCAVQFHPERLLKKSAACRQMFTALVRASARVSRGSSRRGTRAPAG